MPLASFLSNCCATPKSSFAPMLPAAPLLPTGGNAFPTGGNAFSTGGNAFPTGGNAFPNGGNVLPNGGNVLPDGGNVLPDGGNVFPPSPISLEERRHCAEHSSHG